MKLLARLRRHFDLRESDVSNDEVLRVTEGTLARSWIELGTAVENMGRAVVSKAKAFIDRFMEKTKS